MSKNGDSNYQPSDEFGSHIAKLLNLLKKALKNNKMSQEEMKRIFGELKTGKENLSLNIFFFNLMPFSSEDLDELGSELEDIFDEDWQKDEQEEELKFEISSTDEEFLKSHGIRF